MKYIIAAVLFCTLLLATPPYLLHQNNELTSSNVHQIAYIAKYQDNLEKVLIHDLVVFNTNPMTYARLGKTVEGGGRILETAEDSIVSKSQLSTKWAREILEDDEKIFRPTKRIIERNGITKLLKNNEVFVVYRKRYTNHFVNSSASVISSFVFFVLFFLVLTAFEYWSLNKKQIISFVLSVGLIWYIVSVFFIAPLYSTMLNDELTFGSYSTRKIYQLLQLMLFLLVLYLIYPLKRQFKSILQYRAFLFIFTCLLAPICLIIAIRTIGLLMPEFRETYVFASSFRYSWEIGNYYYYGYSFAMASLAVFGLSHYKSAKLEKVRLDEENLNFQSQLNSLNARLNPHFLYNSLNSIAGLIKTDPQKAEEMTLSVSKFMKHFSNRNMQHLISCQEEIDEVKEYLEIEKIRFGDKLNFNIEISDAAKSELIPRAIIQPLVENAIKYGYNNEMERINIQLSIEDSGRNIFIKLYDSGPPWTSQLSKGYGLTSVYNKLDLFYRGHYNIDFINEPSKHLVISLELDKLRSND